MTRELEITELCEWLERITESKKGIGLLDLAELMWEETQGEIMEVI